MMTSRYRIKTIISATLVLGSLALLGCESDEDRAIFSAQKCLNGLGDSPTSTAVDVCINKVAGIDTPEANTIRCSAYFIRGGLTNSAIINAFELYGDAAEADKEAVLIENLSLGDQPADKTNADSAYTYCQKTGIPGLAYVASLCRIGTMVDQMTCAGTCANIDDQITDFVNNAGAADKEEVGEMVQILGELYCQGESADSNICTEINSAILAAGGDNAQLAEILLNQFL